MKKNEETNLDELINNLKSTDDFGLEESFVRLETIKAIIDFLNRVMNFLDAINGRFKVIKDYIKGKQNNEK